MSVIGRKPFINSIIDKCNKTQIERIASLMNNLGEPTLVALYGDDNVISSANIGVNYVTLKMNELLAQNVNGILIYVDNDNCCFLGIASNTDNIDEFSIDPVNRTFDKIREYLTVEELRQVCSDRMIEVGEGITVQADDVDSGTATEGQTLVADGQGGAVWGDAGGGLPEATKAGQVLVSNDELEFVEKDSVPLADMADNLVSPPETNDALYSNGPTGGLADISTGEEAYLQEIKGYTVNWGWCRHAISNQQVSLNSAHTYLRIGSNGYNTSYTNVIRNTSRMSMHASLLYDLTLMFGKEENVPFSLEEYTEYKQNGTIPAQMYEPEFGFARFFSTTNIRAAADIRTNVFKNVQATKLVESGQNLWNENDADMVSNGLKLLPGYRYEIYLGGDSYSIKVKKEYYSGSSQNDWNTGYLTRYKNSDGKYVFIYFPQDTTYIKSDSSPIKFVGFVHSGNYCLTTGTINDQYKAKTDMPIPPYVKHEFDVNVSGLNGIPDDSENHCSVYDTTDTTRVGIIDLSTITDWTVEGSVYSATISGIKPSTTQIYSNQYAQALMSVDENGVLSITTDARPTGSLAFELAEPVSTGNPAFEPIPLKDSQGNWIVNDMGSEYFTGIDTCPVNQVSIYMANLKDKLVNLEMPDYIPKIQVSSTFEASEKINNSTWNPYPALSMLKLDGIQYKLIPQGTLTGSSYPTTESDYQSMLAVGVSSNARPNSVAVGQSANAYNMSVSVGVSAGQTSTNYTTNLGYYAWSTQSYGIAIGYSAKNYIQYGLSFDGTGAKNTCRTIQLYDADKIFFRNEVMSSSKTTFASYTQGHTLAEYIQLQTLAGTWDEYGEFLSTATNFNSSEINGVEIVLTLINSNDSLAFRCSCIVEKYNQTFGSVISTKIYPDNDTTQEIDVNINSDGQIYIDATAYNDITNCDIKEVKYHLL